ncbi:GNAT family N-acetyltransferase [Sulfobacillus thermotolerans]|uniref:GNAT family N-acetyltransferase n=1 Tax=Sulfobacillus thermotolerans TaxID=338644 RepID=A0ABN5H0T6_9FIRM|nr:GNAT family N-acetyltransferase [Sulfobacillus thermotolerans]
MNPLLIDFPNAFETERLLIRSPLSGDGLMVNEAIVESYEELRQWMPWAHTLPSVSDSESNVRQASAEFLLRKNLRLHLFLKSSGQFVGSSGLHNLNWEAGCFEIGYWLRTSAVGQGLMTEAVQGIVDWAAHHLDAKRLEIRCDPRNHRSQHVAEQAGFHREAVLHQNTRDPQGLLRDTLIYVMLRLPKGTWGYPY